MKIQIVEESFKNLTGLFAHIEFKDGLSVNDVSDRDVAVISSVIRVVDVETGKSPNILDKALSMKDQPATTPTTLPTVADLLRDGKISKEDLENEKPKTPTAPTAPTKKIYTEKELEEIADKRGINGLRDIANSLGVRSTSIPKLIQAILKAQ